ncbi:hypothetical protein TELCIR_11315 [Teladorsagia circumcincta]|uniref:Sodium:neurotransmitter symporter family protein n=2 Tax=Teladorsagia circumcincta TaxID=45464 RepID=A0A2G9U9M0_TELCI|nr:hypothetical protein TELCIR_11315 [Teladorsagia circumcincta]
MDGSEWKAALRLQIEALARRNDLHRRCNRDSIRSRTADMDIRIVKLRELVASDANYAAQFYLECVCHADETERILNRTSSRDKKRRKPKPFRETLSTISLPTVISVPSTTDMSLSCLGFIVGIGNMMRFPGKVCEYGGLGWAFVFAAIPVIIYHNIILTWSLQYLWYSVLSVMISEDLPWENRDLTDDDAAVDFGPLINKTLTSAEIFFHLDILSLTSYTELILTLPQRHIVLALTAAWLLVFAGVCRSTTWMAWATRITATIPYLMLFILLVRGLSLPGASVGLTFLFSSAFGSISSLDV